MNIKLRTWSSFIILFNVCIKAGLVTHRHRTKRTFLAYGNGGTVKLVLGINLPVLLPDSHRSLIMFYNMQMQYTPTPDAVYWWDYFNSSTFSARRQRSITNATLQYDTSRSVVYNFLEAVLRSLDPFGNQECLLRFICDLAYFPLDVETETFNENRNLYHHLVNTIFTPTKSNVDDHYWQAYKAGLNAADCKKTFPICSPKGDLLTRFTKYF